jgi:hypothetical protein
MQKLSDVGVPSYGWADVREGLKQVEVIEKILRKLLSGFGVLFPRPIQNLLQIG